MEISVYAVIYREIIFLEIKYDKLKQDKIIFYESHDGDIYSIEAASE